MPLRQTIGISLALLMASSAALAKAPEKGTSYQSSTPPNAEPAKSGSRSTKARAAHKAAPFRWPSRLAFHRGRTRYRHTSSYATEDGALPPDPDWGPMHTTGFQEIGQAAWYDLVGNRTSSGERLDSETPTAAHRSLPLGSCAKVTSLDTGRSVIVKINDRGPYSRRFIIDLSPRAAEELGMTQAGVAAVAVEPVAAGAATSNAARPTTAIYREPVTNVTR
jgi:rare lipoprotein A